MNYSGILLRPTALRGRGAHGVRDNALRMAPWQDGNTKAFKFYIWKDGGNLVVQSFTFRWTFAPDRED